MTASLWPIAAWADTSGGLYATSYFAKGEPSWKIQPKGNNSFFFFVAEREFQSFECVISQLHLFLDAISVRRQVSSRFYMV